MHVKSRSKGADTVFLPSPSRHRDEYRAAIRTRKFPRATRYVVSGNVWHPDIDQRQMWRTFCQRVESGLAVLDGFDLMPEQLKYQCETFKNIRVIICDEDAPGCGTCSIHRPMRRAEA